LVLSREGFIRTQEGDSHKERDSSGHKEDKADLPAVKKVLPKQQKT